MAKLIYPGGWIRTTHAHKEFGRDALQPCVECGRSSGGTVWVHEFDMRGEEFEQAVPAGRVVRCFRHRPPELNEWTQYEGVEPSLDGAWSRRAGPANKPDKPDKPKEG